MDMGAMQGSLVGESQKAIRANMKVIKSMAGRGGVLFIATMNKLQVIPPELRWWFGDFRKFQLLKDGCHGC
jgi:hypothetical protein